MPNDRMKNQCRCPLWFGRLGHLLLVLLVCLMVESAHAALSLPMVIGDHMVLQRNAAVPIWGQADPGAGVVVRFAGQEKRTTADASGSWRVDLEPMPANGEPQVLRVESNGEAIERTDVLIGEVWLCAGQSNMQMGLARSDNGDAVAAKANDPLLRLLRVENHVVARGEDAKGEWSASSPESTPKFSAVGYYFGVRLREELGVPVGLIGSAWGATGVESWLPIEVIQRDPAFAETLKRDQQREADRPRLLAEYEAKKSAWEVSRDEAKQSGAKLPSPPRLPVSLRPQSQSGSLFDSMVLPLVPFAVRGSVWYQGESNVGQAQRYQAMLTRMIESWRGHWSQDGFYFGIVQLPNYRPIATEPGDSAWATMREAQRLTARSLPDAGLAVTIDLGEADEGHPRNKLDVGERLAKIVLADVYAINPPGHGPAIESAAFREGYAELTFQPGPGELASIDGDALGGFAVAGSDQRWHWAQVELIGPRRLRIWSKHVAKPTAVRYAWADNPPKANLTDGTGIPASPFHIGE